MPHGLWRQRTEPKGVILLTESEIHRSFRRILRTIETDAEAFQKAEALLDELRGESPLRHRLEVELEETRKLSAAKS